MFYAVLKCQWHITKSVCYKMFKYEIFRERKKKLSLICGFEIIKKPL